MRKRLLFLYAVCTVLLVGALSPVAKIHATTSLERNLMVGSVGEDVLLLQRLLNKDQATQVATSGVGSFGNETTYFGNLTKSAVIRFQEKYAQEILTPVGLTRGSGYVGPSTRQKINKLLVGEVQPPEQSVQTPETILLRTEPAQGQLGSFLVLQGTGFTNQSYTVVFEDGKTSTARFFDKKTLIFSIPQGVKTGKQEIKLRDAEGVFATNSATLTVLPFGIDEKTVKPIVDSISPTTGGEGTLLTIRGSGFASSNVVATGYGTFTVSSSDGKTLEITLAPGWKTDKPHGVTMPLWIYVQTENGESDPLIFNFQL